MAKGRFQFFFSFLLFVGLLSSISAIDTNIKITTYPNHNLNINFLDPPPGPVQLLKAYNLESGATGEVTFTFSTDKTSFDITAFVLKDAEKVVYERFDANPAGESIHMILLPGKIELIRNFQETEPSAGETTSSSNETTEATQPGTTENSAGITGLSTSEDAGSGSSFPSILYYVLGFLVLSGIVFFTLVKLNKIPMYASDGTGKKVKDIKVRKLSEVKIDKKEKIEDYKKAIDDAEEKIKEAQKEINKIKNVGKIQEVKKKIEEDKEELKKLTGNEDD